MTSNSDDLEEQLRQNLKLRRELAAEVAKARDSSEQRGNFASAPKTSHHMPAKVTTTAASLEKKIRPPKTRGLSCGPACCSDLSHVSRRCAANGRQFLACIHLCASH